MATSKKNKHLLMWGAAGVGGFLLYEHFKTAPITANIDPNTGLPIPPSSGGVDPLTGLDLPPVQGTPFVTTPTYLPPVTTPSIPNYNPNVIPTTATDPVTGQQYTNNAPTGGASNLDPGAAIGGPIGYCMHLKTWTQSQCQQRADALVTAYRTGAANIQSLQAQASSVPSDAQAELAKYSAAIAAANQAAAATTDPATKAAWSNSIPGYNQAIAEINARVQALQNSAASSIQQWTQAMQGNASDYMALFGTAIG